MISNSKKMSVDSRNEKIYLEIIRTLFEDYLGKHPTWIAEESVIEKDLKENFLYQGGLTTTTESFARKETDLRE